MEVGWQNVVIACNNEKFKGDVCAQRLMMSKQKALN